MSKHSIGLGSFVAALLAVTPLGAAQAQDRNLDTEPSVGKVFSGEVVEGGGAARFLLSLAAGQALDLTAAPIAGSDPVMRVYDTATDGLIAENDDSSGSLASNVRLYSEQAKRVRIEVSNAAVDNGGAAIRFDLIVRPSDYRPKPVLPLALGDSLSGTLARNDEQLFRFRGERGQVWDLALASGPDSSLDPALQVFSGEVAGGPAVGQDDDGGGGLNSRLRFLVPQSGTYTLRVYGVGSSEGDFALSAGSSAAATAAAIKDIDLGTPATGTLGADSGEQLYRLSARARREIAAGSGVLLVELRRTGANGEGALDPMLEVGFETPLGFSSLLSDDDGGGENNSRLVLDASNLTATWLEALRIKASAFLETTGEYELLLSDGGGEGD